MSLRRTNNNLPQNLPQLQNLIKRDPESYAEEFHRHLLIYQASVDIFKQNPTLYYEQLNDLVIFLAQISHCYSDKLKEFPDDLVKLLRRHGSVLHPDLRTGFVRALVLLRNKNLLAPTTLLVLFFELLRCQDKPLRKFLEQHIITDIKNVNAKCKNMRLNKEVQNFMFEMLKDNHAIAAKTSLHVMIQLYNKRVWNDAKTVNIIASGCFSKITKVMVTAIKFFVGRDEEEEEDHRSGSDSDDSDDCAPDLRTTLMAARVNKKTRKKERHVDKVRATIKRNKKKEKKKGGFDFSALHLIHDPQDMAEKLYRKLEKTNERFEVKLMMMNLISRLIGVHQLYLGHFYPLVQRFLVPHQREVTKIMVYAAQAAHPLVPPDELEPTIRTLANNFVTERCSNEVMAMGMNAIRELCARNPFCMSEDLLQDLVQYRTHKDKGVMMASRSLLALFRERNPSILAKKDRGAPTELSTEIITGEYCQSSAKNYIPGAEVLAFVNGEEEENDSEDSDDGTAEESDEEESDDGATSVNGSVLSSSSVPTALTRKEAIKEVMKLTPEERAHKASEVVASRFLTDADFAKIEATQAAKHVEIGKKKRSNSKKRQLEEATSGCKGEIVKEKNIVMIYKKRKHDKNARMDSVASGREGREKYGSKTGRMNPFASTTNKEKKKTKSFMMLKHKIRRKNKVSFQTKQARLKESLLKQKKNVIK